MKRGLAIAITLFAVFSSACSGAGEAGKVYFVTDTPRGFKLVSETREFNNLASLVADLLSGEMQPLDPDYVNLWSDTELNELTVLDEIAIVDISLPSLNVGAEGEQRAIDQLVWLISEINPEITLVEFLVNGNSVESLAGHVDTSVQFSRQPDYEVLNPLQITSFNNAAQINNPVTISGEACTFEANVVWTLLKADQPLINDVTTAETACPERSGWSVDLGTLDAGEYQFKVEEFSAEDGSLFAIDTKTFVVN